MFEDDDDQRGLEKEGSYISGRETLMNNSAVKAAIFVFGLMVCLVVVYILILGGGDSPEPGGSTSTAVNGTSAPIVTPPPQQETTEETVNTGPATEVTNPPVQTEVPFSFRKGDSNAKMKLLQQLLKDKGYLAQNIELSDVFGPATETAVKLFQKENGLAETGIVDNALYKKIEDAGVRETPFELKRGDTSAKVTQLQELLIQKGYLNLGGDPATEFFGTKTEEAVKLFQRTNQLTETGKVDNALFKKIQEAAIYTPPAT